MDPYLTWFTEASPASACDFIGQGISEYRKHVNDEAQKRQRTRQQVDLAFASGRMNAPDKKHFDAANTRLEEQSKITEQYDDALIVLAVLGSRIVRLDAVNHSEIVAANNSVRQAFGGVSGSRYFERFDRLARSVQIGVICGMIFCAECYPMHIWRGFRAAVRSDFDWATFWVANETWDLLDRSISFLKSSPKSFSLLKKQPEGLERQKPWWRANEKENNELMWREGRKERKALEDAKKDFNKRVEKKGFPQPFDLNFQISTWSIPFATWDSPFVVSNEGHSWTNVLRHQMDPGRLLHAFVVGGHLNLMQGEVMIIPTVPAQCIVRWLEGLNGMTFKLLPESALDFTKLGLSSSTKKSMRTYGIQDLFAVQDPDALARKNMPPRHSIQTPPSSPSAFMPQTPQMPSIPTPASPTSPQSLQLNLARSPSSEVPPPRYSTPQAQSETPSLSTGWKPPFVSDSPEEDELGSDSTQHTQGNPTMPQISSQKRMSMPIPTTSSPTLSQKHQIPEQGPQMQHTFSIRRRPAPGAPPSMPAFLAD